MSVEYEIRAAEHAKYREDELRECLTAVLQSPSGRRVFHWLIYDLGLLETTGFLGAQDLPNQPSQVRDGVQAAMHMSYHEGRRAFALEIYNACASVAPDDLALMIQDHIRRSVEDRAVLTPSLTQGKMRTP